MQTIVYNSGNRGPHNPFTPGGTIQSTTHQELINEGVVVDVIVNDDHTEYASDGYNIGAIKFRSIKSDMYRDDALLNWALPLESNITEYPLLHEVVLIHSSLNRFYYTRKINTTNRITSQGLPGLNEEMAPPVSNKARSDGYRTHNSEKRDTEQVNSKLGKYFQDLDVYRLRHDEGDVVFEGRSGQSLRFGAAWKKGTMFQSTKRDQAPNILFRVGPDTSQKPSSRFGLVRENIDSDASSIYMVSDQVVPLTMATKGNTTHGASIKDLPNRLDGNQIIINSDRIVLNSKKESIMGFSSKGINFTSGKDFTVDTETNYISSIKKDQIVKVNDNSNLDIGKNYFTNIGESYEMTARVKSSIIAPKVYIGIKDNNKEPISCGALLAEFLENVLNIFIQNASAIVLTTAAPGSPSPLNPTIVAALTELKSDVAKRADASFNSTIAYTTK